MFLSDLNAASPWMWSDFWLQFKFSVRLLLMTLNIFTHKPQFSFCYCLSIWLYWIYLPSPHLSLISSIAFSFSFSICYYYWSRMEWRPWDRMEANYLTKEANCNSPVLILLQYQSFLNESTIPTLWMQVLILAFKE